jgi:hypothetical protein
VGLLKKLSGLLSSGGGEANVLWLYVRCEACGEVIASRINLANDPTPTYEGGDRAFYLHKTLIGSRRGCYRPIEVDLTFDANRRLTSREVRGGTFVTREEFLAQDSEREG